MAKDHKKKPAVIEVKNIAFGYGKANVLENITFKVHQGDYLGIIGPNGGGKTTLLKIMLNLLQPQKGTIQMFGQNIKKRKNKTRIGYVPQHSSQSVVTFPATVKEFVESGRTAIRGMFTALKEEDHEKVQEAMRTAEIANRQNELIANLSGGQRQRAFLARALASEPDILFLDEPTVAVDIGSSQGFYAFLGKLNRKKKLTIVFVSHDIDCVYEEVTSVICLNKTLLCHGTPHTAMNQKNLEELYGKKLKFIVHGHE